MKSKLFKRYRITYFGMVSHGDLRSVGSESWVEVRRYPHCGTDELRTRDNKLSDDEIRALLAKVDDG